MGEPTSRINQEVGGTRTEQAVNNRRSGIEAFLYNYTPKETGWTSSEEMSLIQQKLGLDKLNGEELSAMRNRVVKFYSDEQKKHTRIYDDGSEGMNDKGYALWQGMMSVTAVIDDYMIRHGYANRVF